MTSKVSWNVTDTKWLNGLIDLVHYDLLDNLVATSVKRRAYMNIVRVVDHEGDSLIACVDIFETFEAFGDLLFCQHILVPVVHFQSKFQVVESEIYTKKGEQLKKIKKDAKHVWLYVLYNMWLYVIYNI